MPSQIAAAVGAWSPFAILGGTLVTMIVAVSLAEVGSRFEATGGPYLYARTAFGRFVAFEVGWMQWFTRVTSHASVANGLALALGYYWAGAAQGIGRVAVITIITAVLTLVNVVGIKQGSRTVNALTIAKLVPLGLFIVIGVFFISPARFTALPSVSLEQASTAALLTIFVFGGYEVLTVPAGESTDPRRHVPFALVTTVIVVGAVTILCQVVAVGTLDNLAASTTPLADAAAGFLGGPGALLIGLGALASMTGNLAGQILTGSRMLYALAEQGDLPRGLAKIHTGYRTPVNAILFTAGVALALALSGSFAWLAIASAVARLVTYGVSCAAAVALGRPGRAGPGGRGAVRVAVLAPRARARRAHRRRAGRQRVAGATGVGRGRRSPRARCCSWQAGSRWPPRLHSLREVVDMNVRRILTSLALVLLMAAVASAQTTPTGTVTGKVTDPEGLVLPGVTVTVTSPALQGARTAVTSANGDFILPFLPAGDYKVVFELTGFATQEQPIRIQVAETATLNAQMKIGVVDRDRERERGVGGRPTSPHRRRSRPATVGTSSTAARGPGGIEGRCCWRRARPGRARTATSRSRARCRTRASSC